MTTEALLILGGQIGTLIAGAVYAYKVQRSLLQATATNDKKMDILHKLGNARMGEALKFGMLQADITAKRTSDPGDAKIATEARRLYDEHVHSQVLADMDGAKTFNVPP